MSQTASETPLSQDQINITKLAIDILKTSYYLNKQSSPLFHPSYSPRPSLPTHDPNIQFISSFTLLWHHCLSSRLASLKSAVKTVLGRYTIYAVRRVEVLDND